MNFFSFLVLKFKKKKQTFVCRFDNEATTHI